LVAQCLYTRLGQGSIQDAVQQALDTLKGESLVGYSEKTGYKIQSTTGQEWQRERDDYPVGTEKASAHIQEALMWLMGEVDKPNLEGMPVPWQALYSDSVGANDERINKETKHTVVTIDFRHVSRDEQKAENWVHRSDAEGFRDRILWVAGDIEAPKEAARQLVRSARMIERYEGRRSTLDPEKQRLLIEEENSREQALKDLKAAVEQAFITGTFYFRGRQHEAREVSTAFGQALAQFAQRIIKDLYPHPVAYSVTQKEIDFLIDSRDLQGPPQVFGQDRLGILTLDAGRYEPSCDGAVPAAIFKMLVSQPGVTGSTLLQHFGSPPHGYAVDIVRACLVGLLRGHKIRARAPGLGDLTSIRDAGAHELFADRNLRKAEFFPNSDETLSPRDKAGICKLFEEHFQEDIARDNDAIADAVAKHFVRAREWLTDIEQRFRRLGSGMEMPDTLIKLGTALENCRSSRQVEPTVKAVKRNLNALRDGLIQVRMLRTDLSDTTSDVSTIIAPQLVAAADVGNTTIPDTVAAQAVALAQSLALTKPWSDLATITTHASALRAIYESARKGILEAHQLRIEASLDTTKRRKGFDTLNPDQQHQVLRSIREGAALQTSEKAVAPALDGLDALFAQQLARAEQRALSTLDGLLEDKGQPATVHVDLNWRGREIGDEAELRRFLKELEDRILVELNAKHRVRLQ
jgi:hypothetical protein